jgi:hypothetical protein
MTCVAIFLVTMGMGCGLAHETGAKEIACVVELRLPWYEGLVWEAQLTGTAKVEVDIGISGKIAESRVKGVPQALAEWIKAQFGKSQFKETCKDQTLRYQITFCMEGLVSPKPVNSVIFRPPDHFIIVARPPIAFTEPGNRRK